MWLNVGCWKYPCPGWVNIDRHPAFPPPDLVADARHLPLPDDCATRVYLGHVLEHLSYDEDAPAALAEARRVLAPDGRLAVVGPDYDRAVRLHFPADVLDDITGRATDIPGMAHLWTATERNTAALVRSVFPNVRSTSLDLLAAEEWPVVSLIGWQCALTA